MGYGIWCIDGCAGTWLNSDNGLVNGKISVPSNVTRLSRAIHPVSRDGIPQVVYYHFGVGSQGGIVDRVVGGEWHSVSHPTFQYLKGIEQASKAVKERRE